MSPRLTFLKPAAGILVALGLLLQGTAAADSELERQRALFQQVYADAELGSWDAVDALSTDDLERLQAYMLWPDLRAAWFRATIRKSDGSSIEAFLQQHGTLKPARELRYRYALHLADSSGDGGGLRRRGRRRSDGDFARRQCARAGNRYGYYRAGRGQFAPWLGSRLPRSAPVRGP